MLRSEDIRSQQLRRLAEWALRVDATYLSGVSGIRLKVLVALLVDSLLTYFPRLNTNASSTDCSVLSWCE